MLAKYRMMVRPLLTGTSRILKGFELSPLDEQELESGTYAFSALLYQYGADFDARVLVGLFVASVAISRGIEYAQKREKKVTPAAVLRAVPSAEKEVRGERVSPPVPPDSVAVANNGVAGNKPAPAWEPIKLDVTAVPPSPEP